MKKWYWMYLLMAMHVSADTRTEYFGLGKYVGDERQWSYRTYDGSVEATFDDDGKNLGANRYSAFGEKISEVGKSNNREAFQGQDFREGVGHYNLGVRNMAPERGQWLQPEPLVVGGSPITGSPYGYAANNPINFTDPSGFDPIEAAEAGLGNYGSPSSSSSTCGSWDIWGALKDFGDYMKDPTTAALVVGFNGFDLSLEQIGNFAVANDGLDNALDAIAEEGAVAASFRPPVRAATPALRVRSGLRAGSSGDTTPSPARSVVLRGSAGLPVKSTIKPLHGIEMDKVDSYRNSMRCGRWDWNNMRNPETGELEPIIIITTPSGYQYLGGGHHRFVAAHMEGIEIPEAAILRRFSLTELPVSYQYDWGNVPVQHAGVIVK